MPVVRVGLRTPIISKMELFATIFIECWKLSKVVRTLLWLAFLRVAFSGRSQFDPPSYFKKN